jgi:hypothetical protein
MSMSTSPALSWASTRWSWARLVFAPLARLSRPARLPSLFVQFVSANFLKNSEDYFFGLIRRSAGGVQSGIDIFQRRNELRANLYPIEAVFPFGLPLLSWIHLTCPFKMGRFCTGIVHQKIPKRSRAWFWVSAIEASAAVVGANVGGCLWAAALTASTARAAAMMMMMKPQRPVSHRRSASGRCRQGK